MGIPNMVRGLVYFEAERAIDDAVAVVFGSKFGMWHRLADCFLTANSCVFREVLVRSLRFLVCRSNSRVIAFDGAKSSLPENPQKSRPNVPRATGA